MPFSQSSQLSAIMGYIEQSNPRSLLDVGVGMGQYGFLSRTNLEFLNLFEVNGDEGRQRPKEQWKVRIDGIEAYETYITPVHEYVYNTLHIGNALDILPTIENNQYEMVIAIDILEHFEKAEGLHFLEALKRVSSGQVLISTPNEFHPQEIEANPFENHRSYWSREALSSAGFDHFLENEESWVAIYKG
jgi:hypothetical protein